MEPQRESLPSSSLRPVIGRAAHTHRPPTRPHPPLPRGSCSVRRSPLHGLSVLYAARRICTSTTRGRRRGTWARSPGLQLECNDQQPKCSGPTRCHKNVPPRQLNVLCMLHTTRSSTGVWSLCVKGMTAKRKRHKPALGQLRWGRAPKIIIHVRDEGRYVRRPVDALSRSTHALLWEAKGCMANRVTQSIEFLMAVTRLIDPTLGRRPMPSR